MGEDLSVTYGSFLDAGRKRDGKKELAPIEFQGGARSFVFLFRNGYINASCAGAAFGDEGLFAPKKWIRTSINRLLCCCYSIIMYISNQ